VIESTEKLFVQVVIATLRVDRHTGVVKRPALALVVAFAIASGPALAQVKRAEAVDKTPVKKAKRTKIDLFPKRVLEQAARPKAKNERAPGARFGDSTWKSHALQVGGLTAGFVALAALCGGGKCLLPKSLGSWLPGTTTEAPPGPARVGPPSAAGRPNALERSSRGPGPRRR